MCEKNGRNLTAQQRKAVEALLEGRKIKDVALIVGVADRTIQRWRKKPGFKAELSERTAQLMEEAVLRLVGNLDLSSDVLVELAEDQMGDKPHSVRLRAAKYIQEGAIRLMEVHELEARVAALEERLK